MKKIKKSSCKFNCLLLCLLMIFTLVPVPVKAGETKIVRVGWYEDSYHTTNPNGDRSGYGYEYEQTLAAYTGWQYEYVKGDWPELMEMLKNGEIDLMGDISYTEERAEYMLYSELPMGEEKYYLYANLSDTDISASDLETLNGKTIALLKGSVQETQFYEWEKEHHLHLRHEFMTGIEDAKQKTAKQGWECFISTETPLLMDAGMSAIATIGGSDVYFAVNQNRMDLKEELDDAMRIMEYDKPFYADDLYKKYLSSQSVAVLSSEEKEWLSEHGAIRMGYLEKDPSVSYYDSKSGKLTGVINDYIEYAANCLGENSLSFELEGFDTREDMIRALHENRIDMIFHMSQNSYAAEQNNLALSNTVWTFYLAAITASDHFNENAENSIAILEGNSALEWYVSYNYPKWRIIEFESDKEINKAVESGEIDCFITGAALAEDVTGYNLHSVFLMRPGNTSFAVRRGDTVLLSILNKTLKSMPTSMLTGAVSMYDNASKKVTVMDFVKDNLLAVMAAFVLVFLTILAVVLSLLRKARIAEGKAKESQQQAENANAAKSNFLFNMSHDIRTPMNAILGFTELAEKNSEDSGLVMDYLHKIQMSGRGMLLILDKVLEISRIESGKVTLEESPQKCGDILNSCMVMMSPEIEKKHLEVTVEEEIQNPYIYFDEARITEVILNILSNAIKYTSDGGKIHCMVNQSPHPDKGWIYQELTVTDNGIGMSEEFQKHIFELFEREHSSTISGIQGTGLGMGIVKKLVELMNGTITIKSKLGEGSAVSIKIPLRIASFEDTQPKRSTMIAERELLYGKHILLAEDNDLNAEIAITLLEEEGLKVDRAEDGVQCVEKLEKADKGYYALILMDIQMPNLDGYQTTMKIRKLSDKEKAEVPIIAMTANAFTEDKVKALEVGMNDHVAKPIDMDILVATMLKYI